MSALAGGAATGGLPLVTATALAARAGVDPPGPFFDVTRFGATGDGRTLATAAIQRAIDACAAAAGGVVVVPAGRFLCGALFLRSFVRLHLLAGSILQGSERPEDYPLIDGRWEGIERKTHASLLTAIGAEGVSITGQGVLEGQGLPWWEAQSITKRMRIEQGLPREAEDPPGAPLRWPRPRLINLIRCQDVLVQGIVGHDSPSSSLHLVYCQDVVVSGITLRVLHNQNCDGIIVDSCQQVRIMNCSVAAGSDAISIKSGYNEDGRRVGLPTEDVVIANCNLSMSQACAIAIGSETSGGIRNVTVNNCVITSCKRGIYIRSPRGRGGVVERIRASDLVMDALEGAAFTVTHFFDSVRLGSTSGPLPKVQNPETDRTITPTADERTPTFRDLEVVGLTLGTVAEVALIEGLPERFIQGITVREVHAPSARAGLSVSRAADVSLSGLVINAVEAPAIAARDVERLEFIG